MAWVEILPPFQALFRRQGRDTAASFLDWTGILVNQHRHRQVEEAVLPADCGSASGDFAPNAKPQTVDFYLKKEHAVTWRDRFRNAWAGFGWCATTVREGAMLQALRRASIGCPEVAALGEDGRRAFLATRAASDMTELRVVLQALAEPARNRLAAALGRELARMHDAGFEHGDLFAKHILVAAEGDFRFCILDWQRGRRRRSLSWARRLRDLAALDVTLHDTLASDRLRLRCLRAYLRSGRMPWAPAARSIRQAAVGLRQERRIREIAQLPVPPRDQQFVPMHEGRLLIVRSYFDRLGGVIPDWLLHIQPETQAWGAATPSGAANSIMMHSWPANGDASEIPSLAHTLFRLHRFGIPAPRLLAVSRAACHVFLIAECEATHPLPEAFAKAAPADRARMLRQAGGILRAIHEAGYFLPAGDSWERRLGVSRATGAVLLTAVDALKRGAARWQDAAPHELSRSMMLLSRPEQLRFMHGYLQHRPAKRKPGVPASESEAVS